ncbi:MAG TPA: DUF2971 domain-containing protein [Alphaproteobacteria bacterium]|nr:DUF2971 domain-containing protein [Alphaproteobacteria bacterium]
MAQEQEIYDAHPELFHYTDKKGLDRIVRTQTLWATHYQFLNDTTELQLMKPVLAKRLRPTVQEELLKLFRQASFQEKRRFREAGGIPRIAREGAEQLVNIFYDSAFGKTSYGAPLITPYVTSFCTHTHDQDYERQNGLLSQWRAYAGRGGFAIVFDTQQLSERYKAEADRHGYTSHLSDVVYDDEAEKFNAEFGEGIEKIRKQVPGFIRPRELNAVELFGIVLPFFTRLKHRGFREEREVRFVCFPITQENRNTFRSAEKRSDLPDLPLMMNYERPDGAKYIASFETDKVKTLPIKRIIIGPQSDQSKAFKEVRKLIGKRAIELHCSETPWRSSLA